MTSKPLNSLLDIEPLLQRQLRDPGGEIIEIHWQNGPLVARLKVMETRQGDPGLKYAMLIDDQM
ncbi:MAG: hypothetical protein HYY96_16350 [Candidatus Tectomicrobia bacterium]|nr:hypothetical protein [Candidatus Tectomicrobia bacterium]